MNPGIYDSLTNAEYHAGPGESKSLLDLVRRSPAHYRARKLEANDNEPHQPTPAQMIGTAFHALLLEPQEFVKEYCLALRPQDLPADGVPLIESRDQLVAMVAELNSGRLAKLSTSGTKDELAARIMQAQEEMVETEAPYVAAGDLEIMKAAELKAAIEELNKHRPGLLPCNATMSMADLATTLRLEGKPVRLWADVKAEWQQNNSQRTVLTPEQWDQLHRMRDAVMAHPAAAALLTGAPGVAERSVYWTDPDTGLLCRCRPDFWREDGIIVDVKTTEDASAESFARSIANWRYHVQAPYYMDGINLMREQARRSDIKPAKAFAFLAVEKSARVVDGVALGVAVYVLDAQSMELGRAEYRQDLDAINTCTRSGMWPGYGDKIQSLSLPQWALKAGEHLLADAA